MELNHQADHEKRDEKTNKIESKEYKQILVFERDKSLQLILKTRTLEKKKERKRIEVKGSLEARKNPIK